MKNGSFCENSKKKKNLGGGGLGWGRVRVDVTEVKFFVKIQRNFFLWWGGGGCL